MGKDSKIHSLPPGYRLNSKERSYEIVRVLGSGSFGITYLATSVISVGNISATFKFAIKEHFMSASSYRGNDGISVLSVPAAKDEVAQSRMDFITEANRLKNICLKSRYIVSVNETFETNGTAYYVMEYLDGGNPARCKEQEAVALILQVAEALRSIHNERLLHLDLKPDNIVLKTNEKNETFPVLIDFGIAKHFDSKGRPTSHIGAKGASPGYAPIEQYGGVDKFSPKYDIYSLGAVLFFLCTGKNPPEAFKISPNQQELKNELEGVVSPNVEKAILNAMKPSAFERCSSVDQFCEVLHGNSLSAMQDPSPQAENLNRDHHSGTVVFSTRTDGWTKYKKEVFICASCLLTAACFYGIYHAMKPANVKESEVLSAAIKSKDEKELKKFADRDSMRAFFPYASLLAEMNKSKEALIFAEKALSSSDSVRAKLLLETITEKINPRPSANVDSIEITSHVPPGSEIHEDGKDTKVQSESKEEKQSKTNDSQRIERQSQDKPVEESDDEKFRKAQTIEDFKALADKGYAKAYAPLADLYFSRRKKGDFENSDYYARKALAANVGKAQAIKVIERLDAIDHYRNCGYGPKPQY